MELNSKELALLLEDARKEIDELKNNNYQLTKENEAKQIKLIEVKIMAEHITKLYKDIEVINALAVNYLKSYKENKVEEKIINNNQERKIIVNTSKGTLEVLMEDEELENTVIYKDEYVERLHKFLDEHPSLKEFVNIEDFN